MDDYREKDIDRLFYALSDSTRRKMLLRLTKGDTSISELGRPFDVSKQSISKHLKVLEDAGLVHKQKNGRVQKCRFNMDGFSVVQNVVEEYKKFWEGQFDALEDYIETIKHKEQKK